MPDTQWFQFQGKVHALDASKPHQQARCGRRPLDDMDLRTLGDGVYPPDRLVCMKCRVEVGMDDLEEEPIEAVRARGYLPSSITTL